MKKIILAISLSAIILLSGCAADASSVINSTEPQVSITPKATPEASVIVSPEATQAIPAIVTSEAAPETAVTGTTAGSRTPSPAPEKDLTPLTEALTARVKNSADPGTFEGFAWGSTVQDVHDGTATELHYAVATFAVDFLGCPANIECQFAPSLNTFTLYVLPGERTDYEGKIADFLDKLDGALGSQAKSELKDGVCSYKWATPAYNMRVNAWPKRFESSGILAAVYIESLQGVYAAGFPDVFPYPPGTEFDTVYENESRLTTVNYNYFGHLTYLVDDIYITFDFNKKDTALVSGNYEFNVSMPNAGSAADFIETCMSSVQNVLGTPKGSGYCPIGTCDTTITEYTSAEQIKASGYNDWLRFDALWDGIHLSAEYEPSLNSINFQLRFDKNNSRG